MPSDSVKLGYYCDINPEVITKQYPHKQIRYIDISSVGTGILNEKPASIPLESAPSRAKRLVRKNDIIISTVRPNRRSFYFLDAPHPNDVASTGFSVLRTKGKNDPRFVYYVISDQRFTDYITSHATGSAYPAVSHDSIINAPVPFFEPKEQKAIAEVLTRLDDKIALNRQMCETLEKTAAVMFRSWFVDFDPVKAKMEGRTPEGMSAELLSLFPSRFEDSVMGKIPKEWTISAAYDWADYINGAAYKNMHFSDDENALPVIKIAELKNGISPGTKYTNTDLGEKYLLSTGDILFSWSGSPETSIDTFLWVGGKAWLNQHIFRVVPANKNSKAFCYFLLRFLKPVFIHIAKNKQTTGLGHVTVKDLKELKIVRPSKAVLLAYETIARPLYDRLQNTMEETSNLTKIRNTLIPKLISGELRVEDVEG